MAKQIVEKELGIPAEYQYLAIKSSNFIQSNWHKNKMYITELLSQFNKNMDVLDLGTGSGNFEILFNRRVKSIVGVDYNDEALSFLRKYIESHKIKNVKLVLNDIKTLDLPKNNSQFDLIVMIDVIEHLKLNDVKKLFKNFRNYLNDNGRVVIVTPNYKSAWPFLEYIFDFLSLTPKFRGQQHLSQLYKSNLEELIIKNKFNLEKTCTFNLFSFMAPNANVSKTLCKLESKIPIPIGNLIAVVFSKK